MFVSIFNCFLLCNKWSFVWCFCNTISKVKAFQCINCKVHSIPYEKHNTEEQRNVKMKKKLHQPLNSCLNKWRNFMVFHFFFSCSTFKTPVMVQLLRRLIKFLLLGIFIIIVLHIFFVSCLMRVLTESGLWLGLTVILLGVLCHCLLGGMGPAAGIASWPVFSCPMYTYWTLKFNIFFITLLLDSLMISFIS